MARTRGFSGTAGGFVRLTSGSAVTAAARKKRWSCIGSRERNGFGFRPDLSRGGFASKSRTPAPGPRRRFPKVAASRANSRMARSLSSAAFEEAAAARDPRRRDDVGAKRRRRCEEMAAVRTARGSGARGEATGSEDLGGQLSNGLARIVVPVSLRQIVEASAQPNDGGVAGQCAGTAADVVAAAILVVSHVANMPVLDFPVTASENLGRSSARRRDGSYSVSDFRSCPDAFLSF